MLSEFIRRCRRRTNPDGHLKHLLRNGLHVGHNFNMMAGGVIDPDHCWLVSIGDDVTLAPRVYVLAHDASTKRLLGYVRIGKVIIGSRVFIGACSIIMPGVTIGSDVIIGAGSVVTRDIPDGTVAAGNPARALESIEDFAARRRVEIEKLPVFGEEYTVERAITGERKREMIARMIDGRGYVA